MKFASFFRQFKPYLWRLFCTAVGLVSAISIMTLGFWKTVLVLFCCGIGYSIGFIHDKNIDVIKLLKVLWSRRV